MIDHISSGWDLPEPFVKSRIAQSAEIDVFGHLNNAVYLQWADEAAWAHWEEAGYGTDDCSEFDRGIAILRTEADYLGHVRAGDQIMCGVWIPISDGRLRAERWYQFRNAQSGVTVFRAITKLACFSLSTGKPARMTGPFTHHYAKPSTELAEAAKMYLENLSR